MFSNVGLTFLIVCTSLTTGTFPNNPKPCPYGDSECIKKFVNLLLAEKADGYASLNLPSLNPLKIAEIVLNQGKDNPVNIDLRFKNSELYGLKGAKITHVKGFGKDLTQPHEVVITSKSITLLSDYTIQGKVLILPISGSGRSNITMDNIKLSMVLTAEPLVKNLKTYMHVKRLKLEIVTTQLHFDFKNLFNGDKVLGDNMNLFLNENWKDVFDEVRKTISTVFGVVYKKVINNVLDNYPYAELFAKE